MFLPRFTRSSPNHPASDGNAGRSGLILRPPLLLLATVAAAALVAGACSASDETVLPRRAARPAASGPSTRRFRTPRPRIQLTLVACDGIGEWVPEAAAHPELVPTDDELRFAASICEATVALDVKESKTCVEALARRPAIRQSAPVALSADSNGHA